MANYNEVTPKRLRTSNQSTAPVPQQPSWPPSLQDFVNGSFQRSESLDPARKAAFGAQIQELMEKAIQQEKVWTNPWHLQQLPVFSPGVPLDLYENVARSFQRATVGPNASSGPKSLDPYIGGLEQQRKKAKKDKGSSKSKFDSAERMKSRAARFASTKSPSPSIPDFGRNTSEKGPVVGRLKELEKRYLRLTSEPDPAVVRPQDVLEKSLAHVLAKYDSNKNYLYVNDQLKAIRQDLTVQHIKNAFTIEVYKAHGRLAILHNDLGEFNQCSSQLKQLYGKSLEFGDASEFTCYRVLYLLLTGNFAEVNVIRLDLCNESDSNELSKLESQPKLKSGSEVTQQMFRDGLHRALNLLNAITLGDYHAFFGTFLYFRENPQMTYAFHLMKHSMATKQRILALNTMCKAFRRLPRDYLETELAFNESDPLDEFLAGHRIIQFIETDFDCVGARPILQGMVDKGDFRKVDIKGQV